MNKFGLIAALFLSALVCTPNTFAAPCAGFTDVDSASQFCPNVEWLRNRSITLGCTSMTLFCPDEPVTRLAVAAFVNRLGNALEPQFLHVAQSSVQDVVNIGGVVCQTPDYIIETYSFPRVATAWAALSHSSLTSAEVAAQIVYSPDLGGSWVVATGTRTTNVAGGYASQAPVTKPLFFSPGGHVRFGIGAYSNLHTLDAFCELTVRIESHTGPSSPYDAAQDAARKGL
jgi:hypothetical protein